MKILFGRDIEKEIEEIRNTEDKLIKRIEFIEDNVYIKNNKKIKQSLTKKTK